MSRSDQGSTKSRAPPRPEPSAYQRALGLLVRREHSRHELARKLQARGVEAEAAAEALETLASQGFQDDARFAEAFVRSRAAAGQGPQRIRAELVARGLARALIDAALQTAAPDWLGLARSLIGRRFPACGQEPAQRRRALDFLLRRGFEPGTARAAIGTGREDEVAADEA
jgi:regulatory protein